MALTPPLLSPMERAALPMLSALICGIKSLFTTPFHHTKALPRRQSLIRGTGVLGADGVVYYPPYWSSKQRSSMIYDAERSLESGQTYLGNRKPFHALVLLTTQQRLDSDDR